MPASAATSRAASAIWREYRRPPSDGGPDARSALDGTECAVNTVRMPGRVAQGRVRRADAVRHRRDEQRVVEELADLHQFGGTCTDRRAGALDVLVVLAARRIAAVRARREDQDPASAGRGQRRQRVLDHRMPVAVAEVHRQVDAGGREQLPDRGHRVAVQLVDRRDPAEVPVVLGDLEQPLPRHAPAPGDVLEERHDVVRPFRAAERKPQQRVVSHPVILPMWRPAR